MSVDVLIDPGHVKSKSLKRENWTLGFQLREVLEGVAKKKKIPESSCVDLNFWTCYEKMDFNPGYYLLVNLTKCTAAQNWPETLNMDLLPLFAR